MSMQPSLPASDARNSRQAATSKRSAATAPAGQAARHGLSVQPSQGCGRLGPELASPSNTCSANPKAPRSLQALGQHRPALEWLIRRVRRIEGRRADPGGDRADHRLRPVVERIGPCPAGLRGAPIAERAPHRSADIADQQDQARRPAIVEQRSARAARKAREAPRMQTVRRKRRRDFRVQTRMAAHRGPSYL